MNSKNKINVEIRIKPSVENYIDSNDKSLTVGTKTYKFDRIHLTTSQKQLYTGSIEPLLLKFVEGYNCSVLAYGQTGSGKTYTMGISEVDATGIVPQALAHLFREKLSLSCTFIEIYNEDVIDLLSNHKVPLALREIKGEVHIAGAVEMDLHSVEEGLEVLRRGCQERTTKSTKMNSQSSRSHAIFTVFLRREHKGQFVSSKFSFVDLAGSERLKRTLCIGERARESISINSGLLALGNVISALYKKSKHVPFRDSKLTRILHSCLNGHVLMIACVSSCQSDINETHNTLKYANRAASIQTTTRLNVEVDNSKMTVLLLKKEISKLKNENQILRSRIQKVEHTNVELLVRENRHLKSQIDSLNYNDVVNEKSEDLAQEILKHPFVQNLINDNQKLTEEIEKLKIMVVGREDPPLSSDSNLERTVLKGLNKLEIPKISKSNLKEEKEIKKEKNTQEDIENNGNNIVYKGNPIVNGGSTIDHKHTTMTNEDSTINHKHSPVDYKNNTTKNDKLSPNFQTSTKKLAVSTEKPNGQKKLKITPDKFSWNEDKPKKVTFKLEEPINRRMLFTPRKERVELNTDVVRFIEGYTPQSMTIRDNYLIFSSLDNKVRVWKDRIEDMFVDSGVRHLVSSDTLFYTTRTILKQYDHRSRCMPVHAYKGEISCIKKIQSKIYTGHDDGTLNILDLRNMQIETIKLHTGSIFCIENINDRVFTGSRDHSVKSISQGIVSLSPPHCDSVMSLFSYKGDLISLGRDSSIRRWSGTKLIRTVNNSHSTNIKTGVSLEDFFVTGDKTGLLKFWDFHKSNLFTVGELNLNNSINCMCKTKDGFYVGTSRKNISFVVAKYLI